MDVRGFSAVAMVFVVVFKMLINSRADIIDSVDSKKLSPNIFIVI